MSDIVFLFISKTVLGAPVSSVMPPDPGLICSVFVTSRQSPLVSCFSRLFMSITKKIDRIFRGAHFSMSRRIGASDVSVLNVSHEGERREIGTDSNSSIAHKGKAGPARLRRVPPVFPAPINGRPVRASPAGRLRRLAAARGRGGAPPSLDPPGREIAPGTFRRLPLNEQAGRARLPGR